MNRTALVFCAAALLVASCGPSFKTTKADLSMKSYPGSPDVSAVLLERSGRVVLDYKQEVDDSATFKTAGSLDQGGEGKPVGPVPRPVPRTHQEQPHP